MFDTDSVDRCLMALAHPTRRSILDRLATGDAGVTDVAGGLPVSLNTVSKHIRVLEEAGLVRRRIEGRRHHLSIDRARLDAVHRWIENATGAWTARLQALDQHLATHRARQNEGRHDDGNH